MERARVARELHDGAIQSLISAEMRADVLRRRAERGTAGLAPELAELQQLLRREVLNLRDLMQQMRPVDLTPEQLLDYVADTVDRFRRDTGIEAASSPTCRTCTSVRTSAASWCALSRKGW